MVKIEAFAMNILERRKNKRRDLRILGAMMK
jgi:hypothetical protein